MYSLNLSVQYGESGPELARVLVDRAINPIPKDLDHLYNKWREENFGKRNGKEMLDKLQNIVNT